MVGRLDKDEILTGIVVDFVEGVGLTKDAYIKKVFKSCLDYEQEVLSKMEIIYTYVLRGILQTGSIKKGIKLNEMISRLVDENPNFIVDSEHSSSTKVEMYIHKDVYDFIQDIVIEHKDNKLLLSNRDLFNRKLKEMIEITKQSKKSRNKLVFLGNQDIDLLFKSKDSSKIYMCEIKIKNNHDTGKTKSMVQDFYEKLAYILYRYNIEDLEQIVPMLLFFETKNTHRFKGIPPIDETVVNGFSGVITGPEFLKLYTDYEVSDITKVLENIRENKIKLLYDGDEKESLFFQIRKITHLVDMYLKGKPKDINEFADLTEKLFI